MVEEVPELLNMLNETDSTEDIMAVLIITHA